ncbi:hypothetical protein A0H81_01424 [Grifola frondosa]|uniref:Uncharacterized protein n=1 Tax=Grifola frondosa TaxID=5627 RepID=A0A1C7LT85_GRIFR|nr:hypothetical protein A0H81_14014 [Grifola frondosa]OBZ79127.1 hypothetical protein A0H81_01424 [Grifola frondosa]
MSEDEEVEHEAAKSSPVKGGQRLTSNGIVTVTAVKTEPSESGDLVESAHVKKSSGSKPSSRVESWYKASRNYELPDGTAIRFSRLFMPTIIAYVMSLENPWSFVEPGAKDMSQNLKICSVLWDLTYGDVEAPDPINLLCYKITQKLSEHRHSIGNKAIRDWDKIFKKDPSTAYDLAERAKAATMILRDDEFLYSNPKVQEGLFRTPVILSVLGHHLNLVGSTISIPGLYRSEEDAWPIGAIAISAAASERALWLFSEERVYVTPGDKVKYPEREFSEKNANESKYHNHFSDGRWGSAMREYSDSAVRLSRGKILSIIKRAGPTPDVIVISDDDVPKTRKRRMLVDNAPDSDSGDCEDE